MEKKKLMYPYSLNTLSEILLWKWLFEPSTTKLVFPSQKRTYSDAKDDIDLRLDQKCENLTSKNGS